MRNVLTERFQVQHAREETACAYCGAPLLVGDHAVRTPTDLVYCSNACARRDARDAEECALVAMGINQGGEEDWR